MSALRRSRSVYRYDELSGSAAAKEFLVVRQESGRQVRLRLKHYDLDTVIFEDETHVVEVRVGSLGRNGAVRPRPVPIRRSRRRK